LLKLKGLPKRYIHLNKDVIYFLQYFGEYGHKYKKITTKKNSYYISGDDWFVNISFNKKKNTAEVHWGAGLGPLAGSGSTVEFTKENNEWREIREYDQWIS
jgi:hypothetical protein